MNKKHPGLLCGTALAVCALSSAVNASLIDAGNGLMYDDALNITWLKNANLAATETFGVSGIGTDGAMTWNTAMAWVDAMNASSYLGFNTWRLPTVTPLDGVSFNYTPDYLGRSDKGFNISAPGTLYAGSTANEIAHLFHNTLGSKGLCDPTLSTDTSCVTQPGFGLDLEELEKEKTQPFFTNMLVARYWTSVGYVDPDGALRAFDFNFEHGQVGTGSIAGMFHTFVVLDGNVSAVPVPAALWLFGSGLLGLVTVARRRKSL